MFNVSRHGSNFYVDDSKMALALLNCDRKIITNQGYELIVRVTIPLFPQCEIDAEFQEKLKQAMAKRHIPATKAVDLSSFHRDSDLISEYFCALFQPRILEAVINVVSEHIPDLEALNLDGNKLDTVEILCILKLKLPKLKILHIGDNLIKDIDKIDAIKDLKLEKLKLAENPIRKKYEVRQNEYIKAVQKRFSDLLRLDGMDVPKPEAQEFVRQFIQKYFLIFVSEKREPLLKTYARDACLTMFDAHSRRNSNQLNGYLMDDRKNNTNEKNYRNRGVCQLLHVSLKCHEHLILQIHLRWTSAWLRKKRCWLKSPEKMFEELNERKQPIRYFNRTFTIIPDGSGCCIKNEQLYITRPTAAVKAIECQSIKYTNVGFRSKYGRTGSTNITFKISNDV